MNLPRRYYQELPALASEPYRGLPRIYGLARELVYHTDLRLDRENILAFIKAYQSVRTLTIGELWAVPQMLRIALIESIQDLAASALTELREREIADFWANRLITANRRDPNQLFSILAADQLEEAKGIARGGSASGMKSSPPASWPSPPITTMTPIAAITARTNCSPASKRLHNGRTWR